MAPGEIGNLIRNQKMGKKIQEVARRIPFLEVSASMQPLTRSILRVTLDIFPDFDWHDRLHKGAQVIRLNIKQA